MTRTQTLGADAYRIFSELGAVEVAGKDFRIAFHVVPGASTAVVAPHGGGIEPGTTEIARAIAGNDLSFYSFEGLKPDGNGRLHIKSTNFDEPTAITVVQGAMRVVSIHGESSSAPVVFIGGKDRALLELLTAALMAQGFVVHEHPDPGLQGVDTANLCNRGNSGAGVQMELSAGLRQTFFPSLNADGRKNTTDRFSAFVTAVRKALGKLSVNGE